MNGGEESMVLEYKNFESYWIPTDNGIYYFKQEADETLVNSLNVESDEIKTITRFDNSEFIHFPKLSPDGQWIYYAQIIEKWEGDIVIVENFQ